MSATGTAATTKTGTRPGPRLSELPRPFIVDVVTDRTPAAAIVTMRLAELDGAHAHEINLPLLAAATDDELRSIFAAVAGSVYTTCRRREFMTVYGIPIADMPDWDDRERMERQLAAIPLGARAIDMELDAFDPQPAPPPGSTAAARFAERAGPPAELTRDPAALRRQRDVVARAKERDVDVLLSCHTGRPQTVESLLDIAETAVDRGADLVKIVTPCRHRQDLFAVLEATARLAVSLSTPAVIVGAGAAGQLSRAIGVNFGAGWLLAQQTLKPDGFHPQPLVAQSRETLRLLPWPATLEAPCA